ESLLLLGRAPAIFVAGAIGIGEMDEHQVRLFLDDVLGSRARQITRAVRRLLIFIDGAGNIEMAKLWLTRKKSGGATIVARHFECCRHLHQTTLRKPIVP